MDKKPLIGVSILAVVFLVMASLSNVVGYQSVKSTNVNDSPLFSMRKQRATNQQQNIITSQYLGMGKGNPLQFPIRDNTPQSLKKAIDIISNMDGKTFARFTELCVRRVRQDSNLKDINPNEIVQALYLLNIEPEAIINSFINRNNQNITSSDDYTIGNWVPGCILDHILLAIKLITLLILMMITLITVFGPICWWTVFGPSCGS